MAIEAEDKKQLKYNYLAQMYNFVPVAIETLGSYGESADAFIRELGDVLQL